MLKSIIVAAVAAVALPVAVAGAIDVAQTNTTGTAAGFTNPTFGTFANSNASGAGNFGQYFRLDSTLPAFATLQPYQLTSFTLVRGNRNRTTADIQAGDFGGTLQTGATGVDGTATQLRLFTTVNSPTVNPGGAPNFSQAIPTDPGGVPATLVGISTNTVDYLATGFGQNLTFNFANVPLLRDTPYYAVLSSNGFNVGASYVQVSSGATSGTFVNITDAGSGHLPAGVFGAGENLFRAVVVVPEPTGLAFLGLGGVGLLARRRR